MKVQQAEADDVLVRDGETAILLSATTEVVRLGELGSALYGLCTAPVDVTTLAEELESVFGPPSGVTALAGTHTAVAAMIEAGVLERTGD